MKRSLFVAMLLTGLSFLAMSCSKTKPEDYAATIVGKWETSKLIDTDGIAMIPADYGSSYCFTFTETGMFIMETVEDGYMDASSGAYWIEGSTLFFNGRYFRDHAEIKKLTQKELVLYSEEGDFEWWYFKRIE